MNKDIDVRIILPDDYENLADMPTVYLLHGFSGNSTDWEKSGKVSRWVDQYDVILVLPDGGYDSWYFDAPEDPTYRYETFVSKELIEYIDSHYKSRKSRDFRAITGLSMGGHGAMYLSIRHQDIFGSVGSISGGVDIRPFPGNWGISKRLGTIEQKPENWEKHTVINLVDGLKNGALNILIDCGSDDFFYKVNCNLHEKLRKAGIAHDFYIRPGAHNWDYWRNAIQYHLLYFSNCFKKAEAKQSDKK
jgi:S-formylglutathione hydrolase FrmB